MTAIHAPTDRAIRSKLIVQGHIVPRKRVQRPGRADPQGVYARRADAVLVAPGARPAVLDQIEARLAAREA